MSKYKCLSGWKRHSLGQIIDEYEYNRVPQERKHLFEKIEDKPEKKVESKPIERQEVKEDIPNLFKKDEKKFTKNLEVDDKNL